MDPMLPSLSEVSMETDMDGTSFDDLPYEILLRIFAHLDTQDIHVIRCASPIAFRMTIPIVSWSFVAKYSGYCGHAQFTQEVYDDMWSSDYPGLHSTWRKMALEGGWF